MVITYVLKSLVKWRPNEYFSIHASINSLTISLSTTTLESVTFDLTAWIEFINRSALPLSFMFFYMLRSTANHRSQLQNTHVEAESNPLAQVWTYFTQLCCTNYPLNVCFCNTSSFLNYSFVWVDIFRTETKLM